MNYNILFFASSPVLKNEGGVQRVSYTLANAFEDLGYSVFFICLQKKRDNIKYDKRQFFTCDFGLNPNTALDVFINKYGINVIINQAGIYPGITKIFKKLDTRSQFKLFTVQHNCVKCLNERYREIVLGNKTSKLWKLLDKKLTWIVLKELSRLKYGNLFKQAIKTSDRFVLLSENFIEELHFFGLRKQQVKAIAIPNPASFETQEKSIIAKKENRIIYVGRLTHTQKRVDRLLEIWKQIHESYPNWKFDVVGDGSQKKTMQDFCHKHNLDRIYFHGYQDPRPFLERAKIFTMTSDFEGFGMVLIEAQSYGVVPVAFHCFSSINDIIVNNKTGLLINNFDIAEYSDNIDKLITDPNYLRQLSINGIDHSKSFEKNKIASRWITHFNN